MSQQIISNHKPIRPSDSDWSPVAAKTCTRAVQVLNAFTVQGTGGAQSGQAGDYIVQTADGDYIVVPATCFMLLFELMRGA